MFSPTAQVEPGQTELVRQFNQNRTWLLGRLLRRAVRRSFYTCCVTARRSVATSIVRVGRLSRSLSRHRCHSRRLRLFGQLLRTSCRKLRRRPCHPVALQRRQRCLPPMPGAPTPAVMARPSRSTSGQRQFDVPHLIVGTLCKRGGLLRMRVSAARGCIRAATNLLFGCCSFACMRTILEGRSVHYT